MMTRGAHGWIGGTRMRSGDGCAAMRNVLKASTIAAIAVGDGTITTPMTPLLHHLAFSPHSRLAFSPHRRLASSQHKGLPPCRNDFDAAKSWTRCPTTLCRT